MARNIEKIAAGLGAEVVGQIPDVGGGAFGAAWLARIVESMQVRLVPGQGFRELEITRKSVAERKTGLGRSAEEMLAEMRQILGEKRGQ